MDDSQRLIPGFNAILHGGDYNPDQWLDRPEIIDEDFRMMKLAGCNTFSIGIFAWTSYEPLEGEYTFDWLASILDRVAQEGFRAILATPSGAKPAWMAQRYEEVRRVDRLGLREPIGGRHNHCWTSPIYREKVHAMNIRLAQNFGNHPALGMWHISNEYGGYCYCDLCLAKFHKWLEGRYESLQALNKAWWTSFWSHTYTDWSQIDPRDDSIDGLQLDWRRFNTWQIGDFYDFEIEPIRKITPGVPCTMNFMGLSNAHNYAELAKHVDFVADDQYPAFDPANSLLEDAVHVSMKHDLYRCFKPDKPFLLMESCPDTPQWKKPPKLKRPKIHKLEMVQALGHGAEGTNYFQWRKGLGGTEKFHGAVVDQSGRDDTRVFRTVSEVGQLYESLTPILGSRPEAEVAMIYDWEAKWGFELSGGTPSDDEEYDKTLTEHYKALWQAHIPIDVISSEDSFEGYRLLMAPLLWMLKPEVANRIRNFVERGGMIVSTYFSGICGPSNLVLEGGFPGDGLQEVFGIWNEETDILTQCSDGIDRIEEATIAASPDNDFMALRELSCQGIRAISRLTSAKSLYDYTNEFYENTPAITYNEFGEGAALYLGAKLDTISLGYVYQAVLDKLHIVPPYGLSASDRIGMQLRHGSDYDYMFLENFGSSSEDVKLDVSGKSLVDGRGVEGKFVLAPFEIEILQITRHNA